MKFLLIGGLGYIGQVLQQELDKKGHSFEVIDNDLLNLHNGNGHRPLDIVKAADRQKIGRFVKNSDVVVNLAAVVGDQACLVDTQLAIKINCHGVQNIVKLCNRYRKKLILSSTCSLYGATNGILTEKSPTFPVDFYGQTKHQQERYVLENAEDPCVLRFGTAYGWSPRMRFDLVVNMFTAKVFNRQEVTVFGGGQWRPFVHIRDISRGIIFAAEKKLKGIYNLCNENVKIQDMARKIALGRVLIHIDDLQSDPRNYRVANRKIVNKGFRFQWTLKKGIREMLEQLAASDSYQDPKFSNYKMMVLKNL